MNKVHTTIEKTFREESGRVMAALIGYLGEFELAEDAFQDALITALDKWSQNGIPRNPGAWITTTARHKAIDRIRRRNTHTRKEAALIAAVESLTFNSAVDDVANVEMGTIPDERLKLIFTCCHPALAPDAQIALTLRTLGGLETTEIAAAFLVPATTMAQRLVRAKRKIKKAGIPYRVPPLELLPERLQTVLHVIYLIFNEGYDASFGDALIRLELCQEAIRLARVLIALLSSEPDLEETPEALGLLALMLLHDSRREARLSEAGELVLLEDQDRSKWNQAQIEEGTAVLEKALKMHQPGPYQIQAAISALHAEAKTALETDWPQIAALYAELEKYLVSPIVSLNKAVAEAMVNGPVYGLTLMEKLGQNKTMMEYYLFHAARADLLRRAGFTEEAVDAYTLALEQCQNKVEKRFLRRRLAELMRR